MVYSDAEASVIKVTRSKESEDRELESARSAHHAVRRVFVHRVSEVDRERMQLLAAVSSETPDRGGDTIEAAGWELDNFVKNPRVMWAHRYGSLPVATALAVEIAPPFLLSKMQFWNGDGDWGDFARELYAMYVHVPPFMAAFSVGFIPKEWEAKFEQDGEGRERFTGYNFKRQELLEYSTVPIPMHPDALAMEFTAGVFPYARREFEREAGRFDLDVAAAAAGEVRPGSPAELAELTAALADLWAGQMRRSLDHTRRLAAGRG